MFNQPLNMFFPLIRKNGSAVFIEIKNRKKIHSITPEYLTEAEKNGEPTEYYKRNKKLLFFCFSQNYLPRLKRQRFFSLLENLQDNYLTSILARGSKKLI